MQDVEKKMKKAAAELNFEAAAQLRDQMVESEERCCKKLIHRLQ